MFRVCRPTQVHTYGMKTAYGYGAKAGSGPAVGSENNWGVGWNGANPKTPNFPKTPDLMKTNHSNSSNNRASNNGGNAGGARETEKSGQGAKVHVSKHPFTRGHHGRPVDDVMSWGTDGRGGPSSRLDM